MRQKQIIDTLYNKKLIILNNYVYLPIIYPYTYTTYIVFKVIDY